MKIKPSSLINKAHRMKQYGEYVFLKNQQLLPSNTKFETFLVKPFYLKKHRR